MAKSSVNAPRHDPYKNFKFRLKMAGRYVAGINKAGPLKRTTDPGTGRTTFDAITLDSGVTHDLDFEHWANQTRSFTEGSDVSLSDLKRDIIIEVYNEAGQLK
jgi:phage tail-like protein